MTASFRPLVLPNVVEVLQNRAWLGRWFAGSSWASWVAIIKAAHALPMSPDDLARFHSLSGGRAPPLERVKELWVLAGRRSGKDSVASALAFTAAVFTDYRDRLRPGERATILCLAVDRAQARIVHRYIRSYFKELPVLEQLVVSDQDELLELSNNTEIIVATNSFRSLRGRTYAMAIFDEVCYWRDENFANPDKDVYEAVLSGTATLDADAMLIGISTPYMRAGLAYEKWERHFGNSGDDSILVIQAPTTALNPTVSQRIIDNALARDGERGKAEWLGLWRDLETQFLPAQIIQSAVDPGIYVRPPSPDITYVGGCDPAGGAGTDAFSAAVGHEENGVVILDALYEKTPPFSPSETTAEIAALFHSYGIYTISGDRYAGEWPSEAFSRHNITYEPSKLTRSELYQASIPLFTSGRVRLLDNDKLVAQFAGLRRKVQPGGREEINHQGNQHDDASNATVIIMVNSLEAIPEHMRIWQKLADQIGGPSNTTTPAPTWVGSTGHVIISGEHR